MATPSIRPVSPISGVVLGCLGSLGAALALSSFLTPYMGIATLSYGLLLWGVFLARKDRRLHGRLMSAGASIDLLLVLVLEASRGAIAEALSFQLTLPQQLHIGFSTLALLLYFPTLWLGWRIYQGKKSFGRTHRALGLTALTLRTLGFLFMFSLIDRVRSGVN